MQANTIATRNSGAEAVAVRTTAGEVVLPSSPAVTFLELPTPPSVNAMYRNAAGKGRVDTQLYKDWKGHAGWRLRLQKPETITGPVLILVNIERTSDLADVDNRIKALFDLLVTHGVIVDDRFVLGFTAAWAPSRDGLARLAIMPAANLTVQFQLAPDGRTGGWFIPAPQLEQEPADGDLTQ